LQRKENKKNLKGKKGKETKTYVGRLLITSKSKRCFREKEKKEREKRKEREREKEKEKEERLSCTPSIPYDYFLKHICVFLTTRDD
jgi:hypothetical protein